MSESTDIELGTSRNESEKLISNNQQGGCQTEECKTKCEKKKKKKGPTSSKNKLMITSFVSIFPFLCSILEIGWLHNIVDNDFERFFSFTIMAVALTMSTISYYQAVTLKNNAVLRNVPVVESTVVDPIARDVQGCKNCNDKWKPMRSHHCSTCGSCQLGMDHHCPWIVNCVGYRNHRAFWLFTVYMTVGGIHYCYRSWNYFYYLYDDGEDYFSHHSYLMYALWGFTSTFLFPGTLLLIGLTCFHTGMIMANSTTLDVMAGTKITCPCVPEKQATRAINPYDRGVIANLSTFFEGELFTFWWPRERIGEHDGTQITRSPFCNFEDIQTIIKAQEKKSDKLIEERVDVHKMTLDLDKKIEEERHAYKDCNFQVQGKIYEYWKLYEEQQKNSGESQQQQDQTQQEGQQQSQEVEQENNNQVQEQELLNGDDDQLQQDKQQEEQPQENKKIEQTDDQLLDL